MLRSKVSDAWRGVFFFGFLAVFLIAAGCGGKEKAVSETPSPGSAETATPPPPEVRHVDPASAGTIAGAIAVDGAVPEPGTTEISTVAFCTDHHGAGQIPDQSLIVTNGRLANALVWISGGLEGYEFDPPGEAPLLDQAGCMFSPRIVAVRAGHEVKILNSDPILHNVHTKPKLNRERNIAFPRKGMERRFKFDRVEVLPVTCDVHPWMLGYIGVVDSPYYGVTGSDGTFGMENVPPGDYTLTVWHEVLGTREIQVTVNEKEQVQLDPVVLAIP